MTVDYRDQETPEELRASIDWARPRPDVKRLCKRCRPRISSADQMAGTLIVSPSGTAHWGTSGGDTDCGIVATGDKWWWPL
jgi:hypothetical protein